MSWGVDIPELQGRNNINLLSEALELIQARGGTSDQKADCFDELVVQINAKGGGFKASRLRGTDGAHIFVGEIGHALVISPSGDMYRGALEGTPAAYGSGAGVLFEGMDLKPDYGILKRVEP